MKFLLGILLLSSSAVGLDLNDIKRMKTDSTTISTTTPTTTTTTPTTTTTTSVPTTTTTGVVYFSMSVPGQLLVDCPAGCPSGWKYLDYKCYKKVTQAATLANAQLGCLAESAQLVSINSEDENEALRKAFDTNALVEEAQETWIGLQLKGSSWTWPDGSSASYTNWAPTQPSSATCVQMITDAMNNATYKYQRGGWKTYDCDKTSAAYICEKWASG